MTDEPIQIKQHLRRYLSIKGHEFQKIGNGFKTRCPNPTHEDKTPSCVLYENQSEPYFYCNSCKFTGNLSTLVSVELGLQNRNEDYPAIKKHVIETLGMSATDMNVVSKKNMVPVKKTIAKKPVPIIFSNLSDFKKEFTDGIYRHRAEFIENTGRAEKGKPLLKVTEILLESIYKTKDGRPVMADVKMRFDNGEKIVLSFWKNSETNKITTANAPYMILGIEEFYKNPERPVIITEGGASKKAGDEIFRNTVTVLSPSGGGNKINKHDWSFLDEQD